MTTYNSETHIFSKWSAKTGKSPKVVEAIESARDIVSSNMFMLFTLACLPVLLISLIRSFQTGWKPLFFLHVLFYFIISIISFYRKKLTTTFRVTVTLIMLFILGVADLLQYGMCGMGYFFLSIFSMITPIMFGRKWGMTALLFSLISIAVISILNCSGYLTSGVNPYIYNEAKTSWFASFSIFSIFVAMAALAMAKANENQLNTIDALERSEMLHRKLLENYKKAEEARKRVEAQLRQAHKMESIGTLAGGIAHDFNNILSAVIGHSEMALFEVDEGSSVERNLLQINIAGKRAQELVKQILTFARQNEEEMYTINIGTIADEVIQLLRSSFPDSIKLYTIIKNDFNVVGNPTQIHQILMNLCSNAFHAAENQDCVIEIEIVDTTIDSETPIGCKPFNPDYTHPSAGDYVKIKVSDTGTGIPPDIMKYIFEPYFTTKGPERGTGMGLSVVHGIVHNHGGEIMVESEPGRGSVFTIFIPAGRNVVLQNISCCPCPDLI